MPIEIPNLDDRTYDDLVQEALSMIPTHAPEWTNHNPSDPGIMLIELFAYITEMLLYPLNRVTDANKQAFLNLIASDDTGKKKFPTPLDEVTLNQEIRTAVVQLRQSDRAVTGEDYENFVLQASPQIARVHCLSRQNRELQTYNNIVQRPGHINLVIVPKISINQNSNESSEELKEIVNNFLENKRLLTTKIKIYLPNYVYIGVHLKIHLKPDFPEQNVRPLVETALRNFLNPGSWEFGRNVYISEIYNLLDQIPGVDYIEPIKNQNELTVDKLLLREQQNAEIEINNLDNSRFLKNNASQLIGIKIYQDELAFWSDKSQLKFESEALGAIQSNQIRNIN